MVERGKDITEDNEKFENVNIEIIPKDKLEILKTFERNIALKKNHLNERVTDFDNMLKEYPDLMQSQTTMKIITIIDYFWELIFAYVDNTNYLIRLINEKFDVPQIKLVPQEITEPEVAPIPKAHGTNLIDYESPEILRSQKVRDEAIYKDYCKGRSVDFLSRALNMSRSGIYHAIRRKKAEAKAKGIENATEDTPKIPNEVPEDGDFSDESSKNSDEKPKIIGRGTMTEGDDKI